MGGGFDGLAAPAGGLADLDKDIISFANGGAGDQIERKNVKLTILYIGTEPYENATVPRIMLIV